LRYGLELVAESSGRLTRGGIYVGSGRRLYEPTALGHRALLAARFVAGEISTEGLTQ
jgi:hypothetical protein